jgi:hypothetical protein
VNRLASSVKDAWDTDVVCEHAGFQAVVKRVDVLIDGLAFPPGELAGVLWGCGVLNYEGPMVIVVCQLFQNMHTHTYMCILCAHFFPFQTMLKSSKKLALFWAYRVPFKSLTDICWAYTALRVTDRKLFKSLAQVFLARKAELEQLPAASVTKLVTSLSTFNVREPELMAAIGERIRVLKKEGEVSQEQLEDVSLSFVFLRCELPATAM